MLDAKLFWEVWIMATAYGLGAFFLGWYFGKKDGNDLPLYDIGFRFHFATYLICNVIGELWLLSDFHSKYENIFTVHLTALIWGAFLAIHFIFFLTSRKKAINGIKKTEIFE
jgi:hypothetical protein